MPHRLSDIDHVLPHHACPWCGSPFDRASAIDSDASPEPGDLTICIECASVCRFKADLTVERCPDSEWINEPEPTPTEIRNGRRAILELRSRKL